MHVVFRLVLGSVFAVLLVISLVRGDMSFSVMYALFSAALIWSAFAIRRRNNGGRH